MQKHSELGRPRVIQHEVSSPVNSLAFYNVCAQTTGSGNQPKLKLPYPNMEIPKKQECRTERVFFVVFLADASKQRAK